MYTLFTLMYIVNMSILTKKCTLFTLMYIFMMNILTKMCTLLTSIYKDIYEDYYRACMLKTWKRILTTMKILHECPHCCHQIAPNTHHRWKQKCINCNPPNRSAESKNIWTPFIMNNTPTRLPSCQDARCTRHRHIKSLKWKMHAFSTAQKKI